MRGDDLVQLPNLAARIADGRDECRARFLVEQFFGNRQMAIEKGLSTRLSFGRRPPPCTLFEVDYGLIDPYP